MEPPEIPHHWFRSRRLTAMSARDLSMSLRVSREQSRERATSELMAAFARGSTGVVRIT